jgi:hypothetical protein
MNLKPHQAALLGAFATAIVAECVPGISRWLLPVVWLNTHIHEFCHAIVAMTCGGEVDKIIVHADGNGVTLIGGGNWILQGSAGYVGASIVGALLMYFSRTPRAAANALRVLAGVLTFSMIVFVRGDAVGVASGIGWIAALFALSYFVKGNALMFVAQLVGILQCINSIQAIYILLQISAFNEGQSDASILASATHIPAMAWALSWCAFSLIAMVWMGIRAWRAPLANSPAAARPAVR